MNAAIRRECELLARHLATRIQIRHCVAEFIEELLMRAVSQRFLVVLTLAVVSSAIVARQVEAQVEYGVPIPGEFDPTSVTWFFGCATHLDGACAKIGIGRFANSAIPRPWQMFYNPLLTTPGGVHYTLFDAWGWSLADGSCAGAGDPVGWSDDDCFIKGLSSGVLAGRIDWFSSHDVDGTPVLEFNTEHITFPALVTMPEPTTLALVGTGLALAAALTLRRRRKLRETP